MDDCAVVLSEYGQSIVFALITWRGESALDRKVNALPDPIPLSEEVAPRMSRLPRTAGRDLLPLAFSRRWALR